ncbi:MAG TPA: hypothetical protein VFA34_14560 [Actinomycetota bacterium]|jgi:sporulation protein YlmC with PRC-barrel domain|nr:hypothetical protein [Actinomycetota bacterium]
MMRLGELLHCDVFLPDGSKIGHVFDVQATAQTRSASKRAPRTLRVSCLLVGASAFFSRLGYLHSDMKGPAGLPLLARRAKGWKVDWDQIRRIEPNRVTIDCTLEELESIRG